MIDSEKIEEHRPEVPTREDIIVVYAYDEDSDMWDWHSDSIFLAGDPVIDQRLHYVKCRIPGTKRAEHNEKRAELIETLLDQLVCTKVPDNIESLRLEIESLDKEYADLEE